MRKSRYSEEQIIRVLRQVESGRWGGSKRQILTFRLVQTTEADQFAKNCTGVTADYSLREGGGISVVNRCYKGALDGKLKEARGRAKVVDPETNAKLKVSFFGPFWGNYWILELDPDYQWVVVGEPKRKYLWILSRTPSLDKETLDEILSRLPEKGYSSDRLQWTLQAEAE